MTDIPDDVLDEVERALEYATRGHGMTPASTGGSYGSSFPTPSFCSYHCDCRQCAALARLRAERWK